MDRTSAPGNIDRRYVDEDRNQGRQGTAIVAADRNAVQEELIHLIEGAGIVPSVGDAEQVRKSVAGTVLAARAAAGRNIVGSGVAAGFELSIVGTTLNVTIGSGWDALGRRAALATPATLDLAGTVGRPSAGNVKWVSFVARVTTTVAGGVIEIGTGNQPHQYDFTDQCVVVAIEGAEVADPTAAVRPSAGDDLLLADILIDATTAWDQLAIDTGRRRVVVRNSDVQSQIQVLATQIAKDLGRKTNNAVLPNVIAATERKLFALGDSAAGDLFGSSVAIDGDYAIIGAQNHYAVGVSSGTAYVYRRVSADVWSLATKLIPGDAAAYDQFGQAVAISGDYVIVDAHGDDDNGASSGSAYVFHRIGPDTWDTGTKLRASDGATGDIFGSSVALQGDYAVVGAVLDDNAAGNNAGAAYVFHRTGGAVANTWDAGVKLVAADGAANDQFGFSVAMHGDYVVVGANEDYVAGINSGSAYVFRRIDTNAWDAGTHLLPLNPSARQFGCSVAIWDDCVVVGADHDNAAGDRSGAVYFFRRTGSNEWDADVRLVAPDAKPGQRFGSSVAIYHNYLAVGSAGDDVSVVDSGSVYLFRCDDDGVWTIVTKLSASDGGANDELGLRVAISQHHLIAGARRNNAVDTDSGAAYIYQNLLKVANDALEA